MSVTKDHRGTGIVTVRCDGCGRTKTGADGVLVAELCGVLSRQGWSLTSKRDTCKGCTATAAAKAKAKTR